MSSDWVDITEYCKLAAKELASNLECPMVNIPEFSLHESMSAVEVMDPKMDQCFGINLPSKTIKDLYVIDTSRDTLSFKTVLHVCETLFSYEIQVLQGLPILESTHECVLMWEESWSYLAESPLLQAKILLLFGQSTVKSIGSLFSFILNCDIFEDDDFSPTFRNYIFEEKVIHLNLDESIGQVENELTSLLGVSDIDSEEGIILSRLLSLLKLRKAISNWYQSAYLYTYNIIVTVSQFIKENKRAESDFNIDYIKNSLKSLDNIQDFLQSNQLVQDLTKQLLLLPSVTYEEHSTQINHFIRPYLPKLLLCGPLRHIPTFTFPEGLQLISTISQQCQSVYKVVNKLLIKDINTITFEEILLQSTLLANQQYHVFTRSFLAGYSHCYALYLDYALYNSMKIRGLPVFVMSNNTVRKDWLAGSVSLAAWETIKLLTISRNRLYNRIENVLNLWGQMGTDALYLDDQLKTALGEGKSEQEKESIYLLPYCSAWINILTASIMDIYIKLLYEMNILETFEYDYYYWYMDYLCASRSHSLDRLRGQKYQLDKALYDEDQLLQMKKLSSKTTKKDKKKKAEVAIPDGPPVPPPVLITPFAEDLISRGQGQLARGLFRLTIVLKQLNIIDSKVLQYTNKSYIFSQRFRLFEPIANPTYLTYQDFLNTINRDSNNSNMPIDNDSEEIQQFQDVKPIIQSIILCFQNARKLFDEAKTSPSSIQDNSDHVQTIQQQIIQLIKVSVASNIAVSKFDQLILPNNQIKDNVALKVKVNSSYHKQFPVLEISPK